MRLKVFFHGLMDTRCYGCSLLHRPYGVKSKNMELEDGTAAGKLLFIKHNCSVAGRFSPPWGVWVYLFLDFFLGGGVFYNLHAQIDERQAGKLNTGPCIHL